MRNLFFIFFLGILAMLLAVSFFGLGEVLSIVINSDLSLLLLAILVQLIIMLLYAVRFKVVCAKYKKIQLKDAFYITVLGNFMDLITPIAKVGGQPVMIYLTRKKIGSAKASAIVMMDTIIDVLSSILLAALILLFFYGIMPYQIFLPLFLFVIIALLLVAGFIELFLSKKILGKILKLTLKKIKRFRNVDAIFHARIFEKSFRLVLDDKRILAKSMSLAFLLKFFELLRIWIVFKAIGIDLSPQILLIIWSFMLLLMTIPWLPGSLGLMEFGLASAFILLGLTSYQAAAGVILDRFVSFWFVLLFSLGIIWLLRYRLREIIALSKKKR